MRRRTSCTSTYLELIFLVWLQKRANCNRSWSFFSNVGPKVVATTGKAGGDTWRNYKVLFSTLLENFKFCPKNQFSEKNDKIVNLNFPAKNQWFVVSFIHWFLLDFEFSRVKLQTCSRSFWKVSRSDPFIQNRSRSRSFFKSPSKKDLDQDPFQITSEKRIYLDQILFRLPPKIKDLDNDIWSRSRSLHRSCKIVENQLC